MRTTCIDEDVRVPAAAIARGAVSAQAFGNFYVIVSRSTAQTVRRVNLMKGRSANQVGSILTTRRHIASVYDWSRLPDGLDAETVREMIDTLFELGPFGFRGPAAAHVPVHLASMDGDIRTTQIIAPGYACPSNRLIEATIAAAGEPILYVTSANRSRHQTGAAEEPAHWRADGLADEFAGEPDFLVVRHRDETAARARYPRHAPMSTTVLGFHKLGAPDAAGRPTLVVERHGSLSITDLAPIVGRWGFGLALAPLAWERLTERGYAGSHAHG